LNISCLNINISRAKVHNVLACSILLNGNKIWTLKKG
jgi:hypothetical protein